MTAPAHRSPLGPAITCYIDRQRSLGFKYDNEARILHALDGSLAQHGHQWHSLSGGGLRYRFARLENRSASHFFLLGLQRSSGLRVTRG